MRPPAVVPNPYPAQSRPWVHRCHRHGCRMVDNESGGGIHCPICAAGEPRADVLTADDLRKAIAEMRELGVDAWAISQTCPDECHPGWECAEPLDSL